MAPADDLPVGLLFVKCAAESMITRSRFNQQPSRVRIGGAPWQGGAFQWVQAPPGELAPAGSDRSSHGGNEMAEAFD